MDYNNIDWDYIECLIKESIPDSLNETKRIADTIIRNVQKFEQTRDGRLFRDFYLMEKYKNQYKINYPFINDRQCNLTKGEECEFPFCDCVDGGSYSETVIKDVKDKMKDLREESKEKYRQRADERCTRLNTDECCWMNQYLTFSTD